MGEFTREDLIEFQSENLNQKFQRTLAKVAEWYSRWNKEVYVSFSGGKDSTVLADICARWCTIVNCPLYLVFCDTGLEFPEIRKNVNRVAEFLREKYEIEVVLETIRPTMRFDQVLKKHGYPLISKDVSQRVRKARISIKKGVYSTRLRQLDVRREEYGGLYDSGKFDYDKHAENSKYYTPKYRPLLDVDFRISEQCCDVMKKKPFALYEKQTGRKPIVATLANESINRKASWYKYGCNAFQAKKPSSRPMSFWTEQDVLQYILEESLPLAEVYGDIVPSDPKAIITQEGECPPLKTTGCDRTGCMFCAFGCTQESEPRFERLKETHPRQWKYCIGGGEHNTEGVWEPNKQGLGLGYVFDELNGIFGENFIRYGK